MCYWSSHILDTNRINGIISTEYKLMNLHWKFNIQCNLKNKMFVLNYNSIRLHCPCSYVHWRLIADGQLHVKLSQIPHQSRLAGYDETLPIIRTALNILCGVVMREVKQRFVDVLRRARIPSSTVVTVTIRQYRSPWNKKWNIDLIKTQLIETQLIETQLIETQLIETRVWSRWVQSTLVSNDKAESGHVVYIHAVSSSGKNVEGTLPMLSVRASLPCNQFNLIQFIFSI